MRKNHTTLLFQKHNYSIYMYMRFFFVVVCACEVPNDIHIFGTVLSENILFTVKIFYPLLIFWFMNFNLIINYFVFQLSPLNFLD